jgi:hypothetical protein
MDFDIFVYYIETSPNLHKNQINSNHRELVTEVYQDVQNINCR